MPFPLDVLGSSLSWGSSPSGLPKLGSVVVFVVVTPLPLEVGRHDLQLEEVLADFRDLGDVRGLDPLFEECAAISLDSSDDFFVIVGSLLAVRNGRNGVRETQVVPGQEALAVIPSLEAENPVAARDGDGRLRIQ